MARKRLTQLFPFLLPLRQWQRKKCCYLKMRLDKNHYADTISDELLPNKIFETSALMVNQSSGYDIQYQYNKVHNLKLAGKAINKVLIRPKETFSFYWLVRNADKKEPYKDGLNLVDGKIIGSYGRGLCQLSNLLFWCFLHTPLTIVERHGHAVESFPSTTEDLPKGTDATVSEGWCDLQVRNDTDNTFQIEVAFDESNIYGRIYTAEPVTKEYSIYNSSVTYVRQNGKIFQMAEVCRTETDTISGKTMKHLLYTNKCEITYLLPEGMEVQEK